MTRNSDALAEVRQLLAARIETFDQVEVLLLLHAERDRSWAADEVAAKLNIPPPAAAAALAHLFKAKLARVTTHPTGSRFGYAPADAHCDESVAKLANAYTDNRVQIVQILSSNAIERVRSEAIRLFADSFLLGRSKKDG